MSTVVDWVNGCDFCGHLKCKGCCWKCNDPKCGFNVAGECPDCPKPLATEGVARFVADFKASYEESPK